MQAIAILDLDEFSEVVEKMGWSKYSQNPITSFLSRRVEDFSKKHQTPVFGLDFQRGTEEVVLYFHEFNHEIELEEIRREVEEIGKKTGSGATISIAIHTFNSKISLKNIKKFSLFQSCKKRSEKGKKSRRKQNSLLLIQVRLLTFLS
ncbi:MAG: hypothetical protein ACE5K0_12560 [Candidatus Methanofastidiosia archaeon]